MDLQEIIARIERLEKTVFRTEEKPSKGAPRDLSADAHEVFGKIKELLLPYVEQHTKGDRFVVTTVMEVHESCAKMYGQGSWLSKLMVEEDDADVAKLASVLASKQRVGILRLLAGTELTSGELAESTGMAGGHLHHHLRDLISLGFVSRGPEGRYRVSDKGANAYMVMASLLRGLSYEGKAEFKQKLDVSIKGDVLDE